MPQMCTKVGRTYTNVAAPMGAQRQLIALIATCFYYFPSMSHANPMYGPTFHVFSFHPAFTKFMYRELSFSHYLKEDSYYQSSGKFAV